MQKKLTTHERRARNKKAFDAVIGHYITIKTGSTIKAVDNSDRSASSPNPASPSPIDFKVDVDKCIQDCCDDSMADIYLEYIYEEGSELTQNEKAKIEQRLGNVFCARKLYPVKKYFTTERKRV